MARSPDERAHKGDASIMSTTLPQTQLQLQSLVTEDGELRLALVEAPVIAPSAEQVVVRVEATPINPSDMGGLFATVNAATLESAGTPEFPALKGQIPAAALPALRARVGDPLTAGNEGAGVVVAAGDSPEAQRLLGRTVALTGGEMYQQYRTVNAQDCLVLEEGTRPADAASCFVNPLTSQAMVEVMRAEGHTALVHTAAASNLGQMLNRICIADGVDLVNVVRRPEQAAMLREQGAKWVVDSSEPDFEEKLLEAITATGATLAFDAIGGGTLASQLLSAMERALSSNATTFSRYGSATHKQVYIYGGLDRSPTVLNRSYGAAWGVSGWLLTPFLQRVGVETAQRLRDRVAAELLTTFASTYTDEISLAGMVDLANVAVYSKSSTGRKFLVNPSLGRD